MSKTIRYDESLWDHEVEEGEYESLAIEFSAIPFEDFSISEDELDMLCDRLDQLDNPTANLWN